MLSSGMELLTDQSLHQFMAGLAAKTPQPGGGAAANAAGALAAALAAMVVAYSINKKSLAEHKPLLEDAQQRLEHFREHFLKLMDQDAQAYSLLNEILKKPKDDPERVQRLQSIVTGAIKPPVEGMDESCKLLQLLSQLVSRTNTYLISDLGIAAVLAESCTASCAWNVRANLPLLTDAQARADYEAAAEAAVMQASGLRQGIERALLA